MIRLSDIFQGLDARGVLQDLLGVHEITENGEELIHSCKLPFGVHKNGDSNPSASLNKETLLFNCFSCGGGSIIWLIQNCLDVDRDSAIAELKNYATGLKVVNIEDFVEQLNRLFISETQDKFDIPRYNEKILERWIQPSDYLTERGVSIEVQKEMKTGIDKDRREISRVGGTETIVNCDRVVLPHFMNGRLVGWVARKIENVEGVAKYKNSKGFPKQYTLYNYDNCEGMNHIYVVESPMSVLVLKSRGIENVVATFGAQVTKSQLELLREFPTVTIFMDGDPAGHRATHNLIDALRDYTTLKVVNTPDGEDPASLTEIPESLSGFVYELSNIS